MKKDIKKILAGLGVASLLAGCGAVSDTTFGNGSNGSGSVDVQQVKKGTEQSMKKAVEDRTPKKDHSG